MRTPPVRLVAPLLAVTLVSCTKFAVRTRSDPSADFGPLHTFAWLPLNQAAPADQRTPDPLVDKRLVEAAETDLRAKGFVPAGDAQPDFLLNYRFASKTLSAEVGYQGDYGGIAWWAWSGDLSLDSYDQGGLYVAVTDPCARHMIWLGVAEAPMLEFASLQKRHECVDEAVQKILAGVPPPHRAAAGAAAIDSASRRREASEHLPNGGIDQLAFGVAFDDRPGGRPPGNAAARDIHGLEGARPLLVPHERGAHVLSTAIGPIGEVVAERRAGLVTEGLGPE